ncbi:hypothetical protein KsCSTR_16040 [Candidatus Kuenenia stuttgartiensis]|uniref:Uncharacterized protein n=1 Tax=Kuenenia stuttgartiensis TaxID=174633 RepID=Q1Q1S5_KUEST|nr:hypothetical protein KsCSTR_16040 [Candidatus Kuenenia stuttgartiensis]CAJ73960.1 unknown protein [Candidatus Kuenenia stuttgartiensis]
MLPFFYVHILTKRCTIRDARPCVSTNLYLTVMSFEKTSIKNKKLMDSSTKNTGHKGHEEKLTKTMNNQFIYQYGLIISNLL